MKRVTIPALALTATLTLAGCSGLGMTEGAVIDGQAFSVDEVQEAADQLGTVSQQPADVGGAIYQAAVATLFEDAFAGTSHELTEHQVRSSLSQAGLLDEEPNGLTLAAARFQQYAALLQSPDAATDPELQEVIAQLNQVTEDDIAALDVEVNPRYGSWSPAAGGVVPEVPAWITQTPSDN